MEHVIVAVTKKELLRGAMKFENVKVNNNITIDNVLFCSMQCDVRAGKEASWKQQPGRSPV